MSALHYGMPITRLSLPGRLKPRATACRGWESRASALPGQVITCPDVESDTSFDPVWRKVCLEHGLKAVQSRPIIVAGKPRGTFVIAYRQPKPESDWDVALMQFAASAAGEAMEASKETRRQRQLSKVRGAIPVYKSPGTMLGDGTWSRRILIAAAVSGTNLRTSASSALEFLLS